MFNTAKFAFMFIQHFIWCSLQVGDSSEKNENSQIVQDDWRGRESGLHASEDTRDIHTLVVGVWVLKQQWVVKQAVKCVKFSRFL